jgi:aryl-alcohol dehydrogenase-like predicted oxidoreductase
MVPLGTSGLEVFPLCLGGNVFGWTIDEERSFAVLDAYFAAGGNFIDTADGYGRRGDGPGASERIIGRWIAARGNRDRLVIATKVGMSQELPGLSRETIRRGAEASRERLGVERIDLYYAHQDDPGTPLQETLSAFQELIDEGTIAHAAASNYEPGRLREALALGEQEGFARYVAVQPHYNLLERDYERELAGICAQAGLACVPYFGLARGFLTGKYRPGGPEIESPRAAGVRESYMNDRGLAVLRELDRAATAHGVPPAAVALAWLAEQPTVAAPIASATSTEQLGELLAMREVRLSEEELRALDEAGRAS